jgi:hypothetical protein
MELNHESEVACRCRLHLPRSNWNLRPGRRSRCCFPNPIEFGTVALDVSTQPVPVFLSNTSTTAVTVTSTTITGTNSGNFALYGPSCVGTISANQSCEMYMTFAPSAMGTVTAIFCRFGGIMKQPARCECLFVLLIFVSLGLGCGSGSQGGSQVMQNPVPSLSGLTPNSANAGSAAVTITVSGSGFVSASAAEWNSVALATTYVSGTSLTAQIPASDLSSTGTATVVVHNPTPGGGTSGALSFTINTPANPAPTITSLSPSSTTAGGPAFTLTVDGTQFISTSQVLWNGSQAPTTYESSTSLTAQIPASNLGSVGIWGRRSCENSWRKIISSSTLRP